VAISVAQRGLVWYAAKQANSCVTFVSIIITYLGRVLQVLSRAGFKSTARERRGTGWVSEAGLNHKRQQKLDKLRKTTQDLVFAWGLSLLCGLGHLGHVWPAAPACLHALHHPLLAGALSAAALLGECDLHFFVFVVAVYLSASSTAGGERCQQQHCLLLECLLHVFILIALLLCCIGAFQSASSTAAGGAVSSSTA
jgi:hypothetical protein